MKVKLLHLPSDFSEWRIFDGTPFADNGGDPDGPDWLQDVRRFSEREIEAALAAGAKVENGYEASYAPGQPNTAYRQPWCGYGSLATAYTTSYYAARAMERAARKMEEAAR